MKTLGESFWLSVYSKFQVSVVFICLVARQFSWNKITFCVKSLGANRLTILEIQGLVNNATHRAAVESTFLSKFVHCYLSIFSDKFFKVFKFSFVRRCKWHARTVKYVLPLLKIPTPLYKFLWARQLPQQWGGKISAINKFCVHQVWPKNLTPAFCFPLVHCIIWAAMLERDFPAYCKRFPNVNPISGSAKIEANISTNRISLYKPLKN